MEKRLLFGYSRFSDYLKMNGYRVDKTLMIKEFLDRKEKITIVTRPGSMSKSVQLSMLADFFDITKDSHKLFEGTKIMETSYASEMNQHPVVYLSFDYAAYYMGAVADFIKRAIRNEYERYQYIFENMNEYEQRNYQRNKNGLLNLNDENLRSISDSIAFLMEMLKKYYHKDVMLFIDEYDLPFRHALLYDFHDKLKWEISPLYYDTFVYSQDLKYAFLVGRQHTYNEVFEKIDMPLPYTVEDHAYAEYFGFTSQDVQEFLEYFGFEFNNEVKKEYGGYKVGNQEIYNPYSIVCYVDNGEFGYGWAYNASVNKLCNAFLEVMEKDNHLEEDFEKLIIEGKVEAVVDFNTFYYERPCAETLWGFAVNSGYLTIEEVISKEEHKYCLKIPNAETRREIAKILEKYLSDDDFLTIIWELVDEDQKDFLAYYQFFVRKPINQGLLNENSYRAMLLGMSIYLVDKYEIKSHYSVDRHEIVLKAKNPTQTSFVLEFKYLKGKGKNVQEKLEQLAEQAVQQIIDKKYDEGLTGKVVYIGLAHYQKDVAMKWIER